MVGHAAAPPTRSFTKPRRRTCLPYDPPTMTVSLAFRDAAASGKWHAIGVWRWPIDVCFESKAAIWTALATSDLPPKADLSEAAVPPRSSIIAHSANPPGTMAAFQVDCVFKSKSKAVKIRTAIKPGLSATPRSFLKPHSLDFFKNPQFKFSREAP